MRIEPAADQHVPGIAAIYAHAADTSAATFDLAGLPDSDWHAQVAAADPGTGRMLLVALGADDTMLGWAKSGPHRPRPAYAVTCETSVYVAAGSRGTGVGGALYDVLLARLDESPLRLAVAGATEPNEASTRLHLSRGFTRVGTFTGIGAKHGRAWDVTWFQRPLAAPALVQEVRAAASRGEAEKTIARHFPVPDPAALDAGDRLLLEWCGEALGHAT